MEEERQKKIFLMRVGVVFIIVLIFVLWALNLQNVWQINKANNPQATSSNWAELRADFDKLSVDLNQRIEKFRAMEKTAEVDNLASGTSSVSSAGGILVQELIANTNNLVASGTNLSTSSLAITNPEFNNSTTSTTTEINSNCPKYINCMPSVGEARPCQIPAGCEGITIIAY